MQGKMNFEDISDACKQSHDKDEVSGQTFQLVSAFIPFLQIDCPVLECKFAYYFL